jgi:hypothetical protein
MLKTSSGKVGAQYRRKKARQHAENEEILPTLP